MNKATPLSQLRKDADNSELVQNILNGMEQQNDPAQENHRDMQMPHMQQQQQQQQQYDPSASSAGAGGEPEFYEHYEYPPMTPTERLMADLKLPLFVALLVYVSNMEAVNNAIAKYAPQFLNVTLTGGLMNNVGLLIKAVLAGAVFYLVKHFMQF